MNCKQLPQFVVPWELISPCPKCKFRRGCECLNPRRHTSADPCPLDRAKVNQARSTKKRK